MTALSLIGAVCIDMCRLKKQTLKKMDGKQSKIGS